MAVILTLLQVFEVATDAGADDIVPATDEDDRLEGYKVSHCCRSLHFCACAAINCWQTHIVTVGFMQCAEGVVFCTHA